MSRTRTRKGSVIAKALAWPLVVMGIAWAGLALWIDGPSSPVLAAILSHVRGRLYDGANPAPCPFPVRCCWSSAGCW